MLIDQLTVANLRVLERVTLHPGPQLNVIVGGNGAGKTSILEGIYLAARGRTFRHASAGPMIRHGETEATVVVRFRDSDRDCTARVLGVERAVATLKSRLDGQNVRMRSTLAKALPVQWVGSQPQLLLEQGPDLRRRLIDMGLFHVEQSYLALLADFTRTLKQRNAALRIGDAGGARIWDRSFAEYAKTMDSYRGPFVARLFDAANEMLAAWGLDFAVAHRYRRGWTNDVALMDLLAEKMDLDLRMGFTSVGPQRAEIDLQTCGRSAEKTLSRGQLKMYVLAINFALYDVLEAESNTAPVLLIDDLASELDEANQNRAKHEILKRGMQAFITAIDESTSVSPYHEATRVFHVEHGGIRQQESPLT